MKHRNDVNNNKNISSRTFILKEKCFVRLLFHYEIILIIFQALILFSLIDEKIFFITLQSFIFKIKEVLIQLKFFPYNFFQHECKNSHSESSLNQNECEKGAMLFSTKQRDVVTGIIVKGHCRTSQMIP